MKDSVGIAALQAMVDNRTVVQLCLDALNGKVRYLKT